jgi:hypothetical protein
MGAQWKAKHKEIAANAKGRILANYQKKLWLQRVTGQTLR